MCVCTTHTTMMMSSKFQPPPSRAGCPPNRYCFLVLFYNTLQAGRSRAAHRPSRRGCSHVHPCLRPTKRRTCPRRGALLFPPKQQTSIAFSLFRQLRGTYGTARFHIDILSWPTTYRSSWRSCAAATLSRMMQMILTTRYQALKALWEPSTHPSIKSQAIEGECFVLLFAFNAVTSMRSA